MHMAQQRDLFEINAEMYLHYLYPELENQWRVESKGTFYRNYNQDVLTVETEEQRVELARDGFLKLLPQGLYSKNDDLKGKNFREKYEAMRKKQELLENLFQPFDTFFFRKMLRIEEHISHLLTEQLDYLLRTYFHCDREKESNRFVRPLLPLLPYVSRMRADFNQIGQLLHLVTGYEVEMRKGRYTRDEWTEHSLPHLRYLLLAPALDNESFRAIDRELDPLRDFLREWFFPFDLHCTIELKQHSDLFPLGPSLTLGYNTELVENNKS